MADSGDEEEYEEQEDVRDNEAGTVDDEEEEEEVEEEGQDEYEKDGFIVDEEEEEEPEEAYGSSDEEIRAKKKKRKKRGEETYELDEDDYDLLQEANVTGFHRPPKDDKKKFKRLKKAGRITGQKGSGTIGLSDEEEEEDVGRRRGRTAEEELKRCLFGDEEGAAPEDVAEEEELEEDDEEELGEEDEMADFIVDEEEVDEHGQIPRRRKKVKKKGLRQTAGLNSIALQEAQEIFGDVGPLLEERRRRERDALAGLEEEERDDDEEDDAFSCGCRIPPQRLLEKQFEPSLLEERFLTERDDQLRETDVPERLQILEEAADALPSSDLALREAADWIFDRAFGHLGLPLCPEFEHLSKLEKPEVVRQIANALHLVHDEKLEVPFIAMYRREECIDLLKEPTEGFDNVDKAKIHHYEALWAIQQWDKKWLLLQRRKSALQAAYEKRIPADIRDDPEKDDLVDKIVCALADAQSDQAIDDCDAKFNLHFPPDEVEIVDGGFKRPKRRSLYSMCRKAGLGSVAKHFGLAPDGFGENLQATYKRHDVEDEAYSPDDLAARFCTSNMLTIEFQNSASVMRGARHMVAVEISTEPAVREYVRSFYTERAVVSTRPTPEGNTAIDAFHQYGVIKWLREKPISAFDDAQWLLIQKAEEEKLLMVTVGLTKEFEVNLMAECENLYLSDGVSLNAQQWNEQRKQILRDAIVTILLPSMEKEARMVLATKAKQWLAATCGWQLFKKVSVAPYVQGKTSDNDDRNEDGPTLRVLACCWGPGNPATTFVMLDAAGEIMNILHTGYLNIKAWSPEQTQRKENDQARLLQFMRDYQPHVVVLGAANLKCSFLKGAIFEVIFKVAEQHPRDLAEGLDNLKVVYGDESIPSLYEGSRISQEQLPGQPGIVRRAVALGRFLQNPVAMVASLCGPKLEVLSLRLHPLQTCLTNEELYEAIERVMVTVTNQVGIDINLAASHDWIFGPFQFVSGLGPRKAAAIQRAIQSAGRVVARKDLYASIRVMDKKVFINSAGFIRVRGSGQAASGMQHLDPLCDTRIHPESYQVAKNMAEAAFREEALQNDDEVDEDLLEEAVEHVMNNPNVLDTMDIEAYAQNIEIRGQGRKIQTLELIKSELQHGFRDWRKQYAEPTEEECFYLLSGESEDTLSVGRIVQATVKKLQQNRVLCNLESGLLGFIQKEDLSDDLVVEPSDKVAEGSVVTCRVKEVKMADYVVDLTCKGSDLRGDFWGNQLPRDKYYKEDTTFAENEQEKARKRREEEKKKSFKPRMIVHPFFQNVSVDDATKVLAEKDIGDIIIRPSSKGPTHLSLTLKIHDGVFTHMDIAEGGKENRDLTSFLSLGKTLTIGEESFEDLDEVIARYVDPLVVHLREVMRYRKYKQGSKLQIDDALRSDKAENPKRIPYYLSIAHEHPGAFMLSYVRATNPHHEYISLLPNGFRFRRKNFDTIDKLISYFQKHFNDPLPEAPIPNRRAVAAMVDPRSPSSYSAGSYGYSAGSRKPSESGGSGFDSRLSYGERGGYSRGSNGGRWRGGRNFGWGGRGSGTSSWDSGGGRSGGIGRSGGDTGGTGNAWDSEPSSRGGWGKSGGADNIGWNNSQSGGSSQPTAWEKDAVTTNRSGGAWDSVTRGGDGDWGGKAGTTINTTTSDSGWDTVANSAGGGGGGGWDAVPATTSGGWDSIQEGNQSGSNSRGGDKYGVGNDAGRGTGRDSGGWDQGAEHGEEKSNGWGSADPLPPSPAKNPVQSGWNDGGNTSAWGGVGGKKDSSAPSCNNTARTPAGGGWGDKGGTTTKATGGDSAWDDMANTASAGGGWDSVPATTPGGWDVVQEGNQGGSNTSQGGDRDRGWNQGGRGRGPDRGGWGQGGDCGGGKSDGWGSADPPPPSPARTPAQGGWRDGGSTPAWSGAGEKKENFASVQGNTAGTSAGGDWGDKGGTTTEATAGDSAWESLANSVDEGGGGWDAVATMASGGWDAVQEANQNGSNAGGDWDQTGRGGGRERGSWDQGGGRGRESFNAWGSAEPPPPSPARKSAPSGWKDMASTQPQGGIGGNDLASGGDWGRSTEPTAPGRDSLQEASGAGWGSEKNTKGGSGWGAGKDAGKESGWAGDTGGLVTEKVSHVASGWGGGNNTEKSSGWGDENAEKNSSGWGDDRGHTTTKAGTGWENINVPPASSSDGCSQLAGKNSEGTGKSGGSSGWDSMAGNEGSAKDGPDWGAVSPVADPWGSGQSGQSSGGWGQPAAAPGSGTDGGWNSQPSQGSWGGHGQDRGDRGGWGGRGLDRGDRGGWGGRGQDRGDRGGWGGHGQDRGDRGGWGSHGQDRGGRGGWGGRGQDRGDKGRGRWGGGGGRGPYNGGGQSHGWN